MTTDDKRCEPGRFAGLACKAKGIAAQAEYNEKHRETLEKAQDAYDGARNAYNTARVAAAPLVKKAHDSLTALADPVRCLLDDADADCLDRAFRRVVARLDKCGTGGGCCSDGDCDYDDEVRDCDPEDVAGHIADITRHTEDATACFDELIKEPGAVPDTPAPADPAPAVPRPAKPVPPAEVTAAPPGDAAEAPVHGARSLPERVADLVQEIADITEAMSKRTWEPEKLYAAVLVARLHLARVWRGFATVNDYMDCLCHALTCMTNGHAAIGELTRKAAEEACYESSWKADCARLETEIVDEVLAEYIRVCEEEGEGYPAGKGCDGDDGGGRRGDGKGGHGNGGEESGHGRGGVRGGKGGGHQDVRDDGDGGEEAGDRGGDGPPASVDPVPLAERPARGGSRPRGGTRGRPYRDDRTGGYRAP